MTDRVRTRHVGVYRRLDTRNRSRYQIVYQDSDGHQRFQTLPLGSTALEAHEHRSRLIARMSRGERIAPTRITVNELWLEFIDQQHHLKDRTLESYREKMRLYALPHLGRLKVSEVTVDDVARMISTLTSDGRKAWTVRGALVPLSRLFSHAVRRGLMSSNPVRDLDRTERPVGDQRQMRILSTEEIERLVTAASDQFRPLLVTLLFTGLRIGEALALTWDDVNFEKGQITVMDSKTSAGKREIVMVGPVSRCTATLALTRGEHGFVFSTRSGGRMCQRNTLRSLHRAAEKAGIPRVGHHELRHTFASMMIEQRQDEALIAEQMGHASTVTTRRVYGKLFDRAGKVAAMRDAFEASFGGVA